MKTMKKISFLLIALMFLLGACKANISRNADGSLDVETTLSQQELQDAITASIADPLVKDVTVSLQSGYVLVSGSRQRLNDPSKTDSLQLPPGPGREQRSTHGFGLERPTGWKAHRTEPRRQLEPDHRQSHRHHWAKNPNSTLKSVSITPSAVTMIWTVTRR